MEKIKKKAVSPVITTILLVLISISAVIIIAGVIIPFVRDAPASAQKCFEVSGQLEIETGGEYNCYYNLTSNARMVNITVKRGTKDVELEGFMISISGGGTSKSFEIKDSQADPAVTMMDGSSVEIPKKGEKRTYSINTSLSITDYAEISPIMVGGGMCDPMSKVNLDEC